MKIAIEARFRENIERVRNLTKIYRDHLMGRGQGRRAPTKTDVLRAAVVMLHASMEDLLRSLEYWKLPNAAAAVLAKVPLSSKAPALKFDLGDLANHRGSTIDEVIKQSVDNHLERSNYNNSDEIAALLARIAVDVNAVNVHFPRIESIMARRHQIVHRADLNDQAQGQGHHRVTSLGVVTVESWTSDIEAFGLAVLNEIPA